MTLTQLLINIKDNTPPHLSDKYCQVFLLLLQTLSELTIESVSFFNDCVKVNFENPYQKIYLQVNDKFDSVMNIVNNDGTCYCFKNSHMVSVFDKSILTADF